MNIKIDKKLNTRFDRSLAKYINRTAEHLVNEYSLSTGLYLERPIGNNVMLVSSIPPLSDLEECCNRTDCDSYVHVGDNGDNFIHIVTPFCTIKLSGIISFLRTKYFEEMHGAPVEINEITNVTMTIEQSDVSHTDYNQFKQLGKLNESSNSLRAANG